MKTCKATKKDGTPCGMRPSGDSDLCMHHAKAADAAADAGGAEKKKKPAKKKPDTTTTQTSGGAELHPIVGAMLGLALGGAVAFGIWAWRRAEAMAGEPNTRLRAVN